MDEFFVKRVKMDDMLTGALMLLACELAVRAIEAEAVGQDDLALELWREALRCAREVNARG